MLIDPLKGYMCNYYFVYTPKGGSSIKYIQTEKHVKEVDCYRILPGTYGRLAIITNRYCQIYDTTKDAYIVRTMINSSREACTPVVPLVVWSEKYLFFNRQRWNNSLEIYSFLDGSLYKKLSVGSLSKGSLFASRDSNHILLISGLSVTVYNFHTETATRNYKICSSSPIFNADGMLFVRNMKQRVTVYDELYGYEIRELYCDELLYIKGYIQNDITDYDRYWMYKQI
jgi:hypothetical protein